MKSRRLVGPSVVQARYWVPLASVVTSRRVSFIKAPPKSGGVYHVSSDHSVADASLTSSCLNQTLNMVPVSYSSQYRDDAYAPLTLFNRFRYD